MLRYLTSVVILAITAVALPVAAQEAETGREEAASSQEGESECVCPKPGRWLAKNGEGWFRCVGTFGFKRKLKKEDPNKGIIWILAEDCSSWFGEALEKKRDDVLMHRVEGCGFQGTLWGEEEGMEVFMAMNATMHGDELMTGELFLNPGEEEDAEEAEASEEPDESEETKDSEKEFKLKNPTTWKADAGSIGVECKGYRPWEFSFLEPLSEDEYPKLKKRMEKKLEEFKKKNREGPSK